MNWFEMAKKKFAGKYNHTLALTRFCFTVVVAMPLYALWQGETTSLMWNVVYFYLATGSVLALVHAIQVTPPKKAALAKPKAEARRASVFTEN